MGFSVLDGGAPGEQKTGDLFRFRRRIAALCRDMSFDIKEREFEAKPSACREPGWA
jgi:hypothetical protein